MRYFFTVRDSHPLLLAGFSGALMLEPETPGWDSTTRLSVMPPGFIQHLAAFRYPLRVPASRTASRPPVPAAGYPLWVET